jgi:hypothetical protein
MSWPVVSIGRRPSYPSAPSSAPSVSAPQRSRRTCHTHPAHIDSPLQPPVRRPQLTPHLLGLGQAEPVIRGGPVKPQRPRESAPHQRVVWSREARAARPSAEPAHCVRPPSSAETWLKCTVLPRADVSSYTHSVAACISKPSAAVSSRRPATGPPVTAPQPRTGSTWASSQGCQPVRAPCQPMRCRPGLAQNAE